jgi:dienelactone hydrolase
LILYSGGFRQGHHVHNTELAEELASRGYLVVGVGHSWEQAVTYRDDGSLLTLDDPGVQTAVSRIAAERGPGPVPTSQELGLLSPGARGERIAAYLAGVPNHQFSASLWRADLDAVLDRVLEGRGEVGRFLQPLANPDRLGVMGMSFGGSTAGQLCANEPRCLAGANLDGTQWGEWFGEGFKTPFLYMSQELDTWNDAWYGGAGLDYHRVRVAGAFHGDFTDGFHSTPLTRWAGVLGPIGGRRSGEILRAYVTAFFDRYLKNEPAPLLEGPAPFPEVSHRRGSTSGERHDSEVEEGVLSEPSAPSPPGRRPGQVITRPPSTLTAGKPRLSMSSLKRWTSFSRMNWRRTLSSSHSWFRSRKRRMAPCVGRPSGPPEMYPSVPVTAP